MNIICIYYIFIYELSSDILFIHFIWCQFDVFEYLYVCIVIYYSSIHVHFYSGNVMYESVFGLMYMYYTFFGCVVGRIYLTSQKTVSNVATCFLPTDGAQIISKYYILSTSAFSLFESNIQYPTTIIS